MLTANPKSGIYENHAFKSLYLNVHLLCYLLNVANLVKSGSAVCIFLKKAVFMQSLLVYRVFELSLYVGKKIRCSKVILGCRDLKRKKKNENEFYKNAKFSKADDYIDLSDLIKK